MAPTLDALTKYISGFVDSLTREIARGCQAVILFEAVAPATNAGEDPLDVSELNAMCLLA